MKNYDSKLYETDGHPIPSECLDNIDMITKQKDGSVELIIISSGYLDESDYTLNRIEDKINNYLYYINSGEFKEDFGIPTIVRTRIILSCTEVPNVEVEKYIKSIREIVNEHNASIEMRIN